MSIKTTLALNVLTLAIVSFVNQAQAQIINGGFESGDSSGWMGDWNNQPSSGDYNGGENFAGSYAEQDVVHAGNYAHRIFLNGLANERIALYQNISLSESGNVLTFWWNVSVTVGDNPLGAADFAGVDIRQPDDGALISSLLLIGGTNVWTTYSTFGWVSNTFNLDSIAAIQKNVSVVFWLQSGNDTWFPPRSMWFDDVSFTAPVPRPTITSVTYSQTNGVTVTVTGAASEHPLTIQTTTNLANPNWISLQTNSSPVGLVTFTNLPNTNTCQFFRAMTLNSQ